MKCSLNLITWQGQVVQYDREPGKDWWVKVLHSGTPVEMSPELRAEIEGDVAKQKQKGQA